ncbi:MAG: 7TM domain-containing protein [Pseudomonadota bacterium]
MVANSYSDTARRGLVRDRRRISDVWLLVLLVIGTLPLLSMNLRLLAQAHPDPSGVLAVGQWLNGSVHLNWVSHEDRDVVLYILLLPIAALLTAFTRLTLGIRVLGFRAILIAIGFQNIGVVPSLCLILLIAATVVLVRPAMRRSGMPLYARVAVILCIVSITMLLSLLVGSWLDSSMLWSMAFFPVVILAMLAESVAATFARENMAMAAWRTGTTIALAIVITALSQITALRELMLGCPELLVTQLIAIVFLSEFLDLRLFEGFRPGNSTSGPRASAQGTVVVVRSRFGEPPMHHTTPGAPRRYRRARLQPLIDGLRAGGFEVRIMEGDSTLPAALRELSGGVQRLDQVAQIVYNCSGGMHGAGRLGQVPLMCEMLGLPYTGPGPQAPCLFDDRLRQLETLKAARVSVPETVTVDVARQRVENQKAVWVRPRHQSDRGAITVREPKTLRRAIEKTESRYGVTVLEAVPAGTAITAIVVGPEQDNPRVLPLLQKAKRGPGFRSLEPIPNAWSDTCEANIQATAVAALRALQCRDVGRVDLHCTAEGAITVARVLAIEPMSVNSATAKAMALARLSPGELGTQIVRAAASRWRNRLADRPEHPAIELTTIHPRRPSQCDTSASSASA